MEYSNFRSKYSYHGLSGIFIIDPLGLGEFTDHMIQEYFPWFFWVWQVLHMKRGKKKREKHFKAVSNRQQVGVTFWV